MLKKLLLIICLFAAFLLSGCWSSKEPKELAVIDSTLYDIDEDGTYSVTLAILNPTGLGGSGMTGGSGSGHNPFITITGKGPSLREAIANTAETRSMMTFGSHNKVIFMSESFAKESIVPLMDMITREYITDEKPLLVVISGSEPEKIFDCMIGTQQLVGEYIHFKSIHQPKDTAHGVFVATLEFIRDYYTEGKEPVAGLLVIAESKDKPSGDVGQTKGGASGGQIFEIKYSGLAAFINGRLEGFMDGQEAEAYNFITNKMMGASFTVPTGENGTAAVKITESRAKIKSDIIEGRAVIKVSIKASATIIEESGGLDVTKREGIKIIEDALNAQMEEQFLKSVVKAQNELKSDIFGFGESLNIQHPDKWRDVKNNWNEEWFSFADVRVTVKTSIMTTGGAGKPFYMTGAD